MKITTSGLAPELFQSFFTLNDEQLRERGIERVIVAGDVGIGYPCRVSLAFAQPGEELLLLNYRHLDVARSPYRSDGPIFVRRHVTQFFWDGNWPEIVMQRAMSARAYDRDGIMIEADVAEKGVLKNLVSEWLARAEIKHVDIHSMRRGCFFCRFQAL